MSMRRNTLEQLPGTVRHGKLERNASSLRCPVLSRVPLSDKRVARSKVNKFHPITHRLFLLNRNNKIVFCKNTSCVLVILLPPHGCVPAPFPHQATLRVCCSTSSFFGVRFNFFILDSRQPAEKELQTVLQGPIQQGELIAHRAGM